MTNKNTLIAHSDIVELRELVLIIWKARFAILITNLIFLLAGYFYGTIQPKVYQTTVTFRISPDYLFKQYHEVLHIFQLESNFYITNKKIVISNDNKENISTKFSKKFITNLLSMSNLLAFLDQNEEFNDFKLHLKENNIKPVDYFKGKLNLIKKENNLNELTFIYSKPLNEDFLNKYVLFTQKHTEIFLKEEITNKILNVINYYKENYEIAKSINFEKPVLEFYNLENILISDPSILFYRGTKVLDKQIAYLEDKKNKINDLNIIDTLISEKSINSYVISKSINFYILISLLLGLFFSILVTLFKKFILST